MRQIKTGIFIVEGLNSFAVTFYFYYFYFFMEKKFDFDNKANLTLAAASGLLYVPAAFFGGRFAQRAGYFTALKIGFAIMIVSLTAGWLFANSPAAHITVMLTTIVGMCFTWPTLEALASEGENYDGLQRAVGIYNVVWAFTGALAYFIGGAMLEKLSFNSIFFVPAAILGVQLVLAIYLQRKAGLAGQKASVDVRGTPLHPPRPHAPAKTKAFLHMAWLANPFAYIAINTLVAVMPGIAGRLGLSTTMVGLYCSLWCFVRLGVFFGLWYWPGWHYKFRWLLASYLGLMVSFTTILLAPNLAAIVIAQVIFGAALGLIYYSSLFYSMEVGEARGEHGGIHEAAIGLGNFAGPAVGAAALHFLPQHPNSGAIAVSALLLCGLGGLTAIWRTVKS